MLWNVLLNNGETRTFDMRPEVGDAGELICQIEIEIVEGLSTDLAYEDATFAPGVWREVCPVVEALPNQEDEDLSSDRTETRMVTR